MELQEVIHHRLQSSPSRWNWSLMTRLLAELDFNFTEKDLTEVAHGEQASTRLKATGLELESNKAVAGLNFNFTEVALSWSCTRRRRKSTLQWNCRDVLVPPPLSATPVQCWQGGRQVHRGTSRVGLVLPTSQYCRGVCGGSLSATLMQSKRVGRQVQRGDSQIGPCYIILA